MRWGVWPFVSVLWSRVWVSSGETSGLPGEFPKRMPVMVDVVELFKEITSEVSEVMSSIEWAEDEIRSAQRRHPTRADELVHSFALICPPGGVPIRTEGAVRAYARELLERVARGEDTRSGTAVEVCMALKEASLRAPLSHEGFGLYARMWAAAGLPEVDGIVDMRAHYEAISTGALDVAEAQARAAICRRDRVWTKPDCGGFHHGVPTPCRYAAGSGDVDAR